MTFLHLHLKVPHHLSSEVPKKIYWAFYSAVTFLHLYLKVPHHLSSKCPHQFLFCWFLFHWPFCTYTWGSLSVDCWVRFACGSFILNWCGMRKNWRSQPCTDKYLHTPEIKSHQCVTEALLYSPGSPGEWFRGNTSLLLIIISLVAKWKPVVTNVLNL